MFRNITSIAANLAKGKLNLCQKDGHKKVKTITKNTSTTASRDARLTETQKINLSRESGMDSI